MDRTNFWILLILGLFLASPVGAQVESALPGSDTAADASTDTAVADDDASDSQTQYQLGYQAYQQGNLPEAIQRLERSLRADSTFSRARYWLGKFYYVNGNNDSALQTWRNRSMTSELGGWMEREIEMHRIRYDQHSFQLSDEWEFAGFVPGDVHGDNRLTNPSSIEPSPRGGWYVASYQLGKIIRYSSEGRVLDVHTGFNQPVDLHYRDGEGLLVLNGGDGSITRLSDTGLRTQWSQASIPGGQKLLESNNRLYVFDISNGSITQLSADGDTVTRIWQAGPQRTINDVTIGPDDRFWVLDQSAPEVLVLDRYGRVQQRTSFPQGMSPRRIWWQNEYLVGAGVTDFYRLNPDTLEPSRFELSQGSINGGEVSDVLMEGDQVILSLFDSSGLAVYRMNIGDGPAMLIQSGRAEFRKFPIVRLNMIVEDPVKAGRFQNLQDQHLAINVDGQKVLPSLLRHAHTIYSAGWTMIIDNRMDELRWQEIRPRLIDFVSESPQGSKGTVWETGEDIVRQGYTDRNVLHRNALSRIQVSPGAEKSDTVVPRLLELALDGAFQRRGSDGVILVSNNIPSNSNRVTRIAQRFKNNKVPLLIVNPSATSISDSHPFREVAPSRYYDFNNPDMDRAWMHYQQHLQSHYTAIFRSTLSYQQSNEWRPYELVFDFYDTTFRYSGAYLMP